jgi:LysM repeat protein
MKKKLFGLLTLLFLLGSIASTVFAASLRFQVTQEVVNFYVNADGTATIEYYYNFLNDPGSLIDYVDIGVPNSDYSLSNISADVNGNKIYDITDSPYVTPGVAIGLGTYTIQSGATGQLHVVIANLPNMFYEADISKNNLPYASFNFEPNSFGSEYAHGTTDMAVNLYLPPGVQNDEPTYIPPKGWPGQSAPTTGVASNGLSYYSWRTSNANAYTAYQFGATFPARLIPSSAVQKKPLLNIHISSDTVLIVGFLGCFALIFGFSIYGATVGAKKRKLQYLPPKIAIEGMGIKRGLTAVEAAILMEQPMDKIMTMVLFSTIKKGAARVVTKDPLTMEVVSPLPDNLQTYEVDFLKAFEPTSYTIKQGDTWAAISSNANVPAATIKEFNKLQVDTPVPGTILKIPTNKRKALQDMMVNLVKTITEKMKGFSRKETVAYYTDIMKKAWEQVETAQTPDVKMEKFDEQLDWTMLDSDFDNRTRNVFRTGPVFVPIWWGNYDPVYRAGGAASMPAATGGQPGGGGININIPRPSVPGADFAASMVNGVQGAAASVVGDVTAFTGGVTNLTNPVPTPAPSSGSGRGLSGGGGGGHCVCACACACAGCACACAGGGR